MVFLFTTAKRDKFPLTVGRLASGGRHCLMRNTVSICENHVFKRLYRSGQNKVTPYFAVYYRKNKATYNRLGLTASKKIGNAVQRNRARRLLRESYRLLEDQIAVGYDIVLVARKKSLYVKMQTVKNALEPVLCALPSSISK